jgi:hypothetical protein
MRKILAVVLALVGLTFLVTLTAAQTAETEPVEVTKDPVTALTGKVDRLSMSFYGVRLGDPITAVPRQLVKQNNDWTTNNGGRADAPKAIGVIHLADPDRNVGTILYDASKTIYAVTVTDIFPRATDDREMQMLCGRAEELRLGQDGDVELIYYTRHTVLTIKDGRVALTAYK